MLDAVELNPESEGSVWVDVRHGLQIPEGIGGCTVEFLVDGRDLPAPAPALAMFHPQDFLSRPVEVIRDVGYLLVDLLQGVANYPPWPTARPSPPPRRSMSNSFWQEGHFACTFGEPSSLMRR